MKHRHYYLLMTGIFVAGFIWSVVFGVTKQVQLVCIIITAFLYVGLGMYHHLKEHSISAKIVLEYVIIAMLGISVTFYVVSGNL